VRRAAGTALVDDLEIAAAGELLELHQREVGLDAGGVAIHDEADRARGRDDRRLGVAIAVLLAEGERASHALRFAAASSSGRVLHGAADRAAPAFTDSFS
jgi:hypothetical protein